MGRRVHMVGRLSGTAESPAMTAPSSRPTPFAPVGVVTAVIAVLGWVLALARPWGDVGVDDGSLVTGRPVVLLAGLGIGAIGALVVAVVIRHRVGRVRTRWSALAGAGVVVLGAVLTVAALRTAGAQVLPRDGSWWGLLTAITVTVSGLAVALAGVIRPTGRVGGLVTLAVAVVLPIALVVTGVVVAPGWSEHRIAGDHPAAFGESPGPATLDRVAWTQGFGDDLTAVLGGRLIVARDDAGTSGCDLEVRALDAGTGQAVWSLQRPLRCDGPRLALLDGNNSTVRLTLRGATGGKPLTGTPLSLYLGLEDGRPFTPSSALAAVQAWTEGFGLVQTATELRGLDSRTGVTLWSRPRPTCSDGPATLGIPAAPAPGERAARTPYDGGAPNGTVPVLSVGNDVVVGTACFEGVGRNDTVRRVWMIDVVDGATSDRTVELPTPESLTVGTDYAGASTPAATTFLSWLDTVVAVVPVAAPESYGGVRVGLVGLDRPGGRVLWTRAASIVRTLDVSPTDGFVSVSGVPDRSGGSGGAGPTRYGVTVVLGARTGAVLAERDEPSPVLASVALTGGRAEFTADSTVVVRNPVSGAAGDPVATPDCRVELDREDAPALAGPGGVVVRCAPRGSAAPAFLGLVGGG